MHFIKTKLQYRIQCLIGVIKNCVYVYIIISYGETSIEAQV